MVVSLIGFLNVHSGLVNREPKEGEELRFSTPKRGFQTGMLIEREEMTMKNREKPSKYCTFESGYVGLAKALNIPWSLPF